MTKETRQSFLFAGLAVFFWSTIATAFKLALRELTPAQLLLIASLTSLLILFIIVLLEGSLSELKKINVKQVLSSMLMGALNPLIYYLVLLEAYQRLPAQVAQPLNMIWPIVLVFLSVPFLKTRVPARSYISLLVSLIGVYLISSQGKPFSPGESDFIGIILAAGSSIFWAMYFILNMKDKRRDSHKLLLNFLFAFFYIAVLNLVKGDLQGISKTGLLSGVYVGIFEMGITFFLWLKALSLARSPDRISNLVFLAPFLSLVFISIILKESIHLTTISGLVIIVGSIIYQNCRRKNSNL